MLCACPLRQMTEMSPEKENKSTAPLKALVKDEVEASDDGTISTASSYSPSSSSDSVEGMPVEPHPALTGAICAFDPSMPLANFSPGPAPMPEAVMRSIQAELLDVGGTGVSILSVSHRSPEFGAVYHDAVAALRRVLKLPATHEILFAHGGGHGQFAAVPLNLCPAGKECTADYILNGTWSRRAADEAAKFVTVRTAAESDDTRLPPRDEWDLDARASYRYICSNETVGGTEFWELPVFEDGVCTHPTVPLKFHSATQPLNSNPDPLTLNDHPVCPASPSCVA